MKLKKLLEKVLTESDESPLFKEVATFIDIEAKKYGFESDTYGIRVSTDITRTDIIVGREKAPGIINLTLSVLSTNPYGVKDAKFGYLTIKTFDEKARATIQRYFKSVSDMLKIYEQLIKKLDQIYSGLPR